MEFIRQDPIKVLNTAQQKINEALQNALATTANVADQCHLARVFESKLSSKGIKDRVYAIDDLRENIIQDKGTDTANCIPADKDDIRYLKAHQDIKYVYFNEVDNPITADDAEDIIRAVKDALQEQTNE